MTLAIVGLAVVLVAVIAVVVLRGRRPAPPQDPRPEAMAPPQPAISPALAPMQAGFLDGATAPAPELKMVSCTVDNGVHGAMPPFGRLRATHEGIVFEASSRVMAATAAGFSSGDGASTMQSVGSVEMGQFHFDVPRADVRDVSAAGARVTVQTASRTLVFEGIGPSAKQLQGWLRDHGYGA